MTCPDSIDGVTTMTAGATVEKVRSRAGLAISKLALLEPPIGSDADRSAQSAFTAELAKLVGDGRRDAAVEHFLTGIGVPVEMVAGMRGSESWSAMEAVAHTLVYDSLISEATTQQLLASMTVLVLVLDSEGSDDDLSGVAATVARSIPAASHRSLAGEWHGVADEILAPVLIEFLLRGPRSTA